MVGWGWCLVSTPLGGLWRRWRSLGGLGRVDGLGLVSRVTPLGGLWRWWRGVASGFTYTTWYRDGFLGEYCCAVLCVYVTDKPENRQVLENQLVRRDDDVEGLGVRPALRVCQSHSTLI